MNSAKLSSSNYGNNTWNTWNWRFAMMIVWYTCKGNSHHNPLWHYLYQFELDVLNVNETHSIHNCRLMEDSLSIIITITITITIIMMMLMMRWWWWCGPPIVTNERKSQFSTVYFSILRLRVRLAVCHQQYTVCARVLDRWHSTELHWNVVVVNHVFGHRKTNTILVEIFTHTHLFFLNYNLLVET